MKKTVTEYENMSLVFESLFRSEIYSKERLDKIKKEMINFVEKITALKNTKEKDRSAYMDLYQEYDLLYRRSAHLKQKYSELSKKFEQKTAK